MARRSIKESKTAKRSVKETLTGAFQKAERQFHRYVKNIFVDDESPSVRARQHGIPSIASIEAQLNRSSLAHLLPYECYDDECELYFNQDTVGFVIQAQPVSGLGPEDLNILNSLFSMSHPSETIIQVSLYADPNVEPILDRWAQSTQLPPQHAFSAVVQQLARKRVSYLKESKWKSLFKGENVLLRNFRLMISVTVPVQQGVAAVDIAQEELAQLQRMKASMISTLKSAGIASQSMPPVDFIRIINGLLNPKKTSQPPLDYDENMLINEQCIDEDTVALWGAGMGSFVHEDQAYSLIPYHVRQFPQLWSGELNTRLIGSVLSNTLRHGCPFLMTMTVRIPDQLDEQFAVKSKQTRATQMSSSDISKFVPAWAERRQDWTFVQKKIDEGNKLLDSFFEVLLICPEGTEEANDRALKGVFEGIGWVLSRSRYIALHAVLGALPMGMSQDTKKALTHFGHFKKQLSWTCTHVAPWVAEGSMSASPVALLVGRRGQIGFFDNFDNDAGNYNMSCCATSGSGKSFFTQELVMRTIARNGRIFIIDAGHSYRNINRLLNGTYIDFGERVPNLNPFSSIDSANPEHFREQLPLLKSLFAQMASPRDTLNQAFHSALEKAIHRAWHIKSQDTCVDDVIWALHDDVEPEGGLSAEANFLIKALYSYSSDGVYGRHFNGPANIDLSNQFVVLELDALNATPDLQSVVLFMLMAKITQEMYHSGDRSQRKMCIIDEAWRLLRFGASSEFIEEGYRVARKHGGCFMTVTQKLSDYFTSATARAAYMNSDFSLFLRQKPDALQEAEMEGYIDNTGGRLDLLKTLSTVKGQYSEMAINSPKGWSVHRLYADPYAVKLFSTTAEDVDAIQNMQKEGIPIHEAIEILVEQEAALKAVTV